MSMVHGSSGINLPASKELLSEVRIVAGMAKATIGTGVVNWDALGEDNDKIRDMIARVLPIYGNFNEDVRKPRGFWLRNPATCREWNTPTKRANFAVSDLREATEWQEVSAKSDTFVLQTFRSHDQYNTTIYGMDDRYRGVYGVRNVMFINPADMEKAGIEAGALVDITGTYDDGRLRQCKGFRVVPYDTPVGCIAGYYPEMNELVPHQTVGDQSFTPTSKSVIVRISRHAP